MGVTLTWDDDSHTILHYTFTTPWSVSEYRSAIRQAVEMTRAAGHPTDSIIDLSSSQRPPDNVLQFLREPFMQIPPDHLTIVIVDTKVITSVMMNVVRRVYTAKANLFHVVPTLDEARDLIRRRRAEAAVSER